MRTDVDDYSPDIGKLLAIPVFVFLLTGVLARGYADTVQLLPLSLLSVTRLARGLLVVGFYFLLIGLYLLRGQARASSHSLIVNTAAIAATFLPFAFPMLGSPDLNLLGLAVGDLVMLAGIGWSLWALALLGKNISIIPQARQLVRSGPYALVRHPLYVGEIVTALGLTVAVFSWPVVGLFILFTSLQLYRAVNEEILLTTAFAEYDDYRRATARFIPGLV